MTDKEKLEIMLPYAADRIEEIVSQFMRLHIGEFSPSRLRDFVKMIEIFLDTKIRAYEIALDNSLEKATYIKSYLEGNMWKDEQIARENVGAQIENAESIIDYWYLAKGERKEK